VSRGAYRIDARSGDRLGSGGYDYHNAPGYLLKGGGPLTAEERSELRQAEIQGRLRRIRRRRARRVVMTGISRIRTKLPDARYFDPLFEHWVPVRSQSAACLPETFTTITTVSATWAFVAQPSQLCGLNAKTFS
jgi:hypothetical protein